MYKLTLKHHIDSSHKLQLDYESKCQRLHGHRWEFIIEIKKETLNKNGMVIDFGKLKAIIDKLDHRHLNDILDFNPTAENISKYLYNKINEEVLGEIKITVFETPDASITYYE